ncbi:FAD-binding domain-containing protein [Mycena sp. CBHHK59/15]|nr:FAD-binding domain-containing protein [Mycena sp. CBHHK59/15]
MGLIWLKKPTLWHSSRVPSGYNYAAMTDAQKKLIVTRWHDWYTADWDYGQTTLIFFCVAIALAAIINKVAWIRARSLAGHSEKASPKPRFFDKFIASFRYANSRQFHVFHWYAPPLSAIIGVGGMSIFILALMLGARPFYWENYEMGHSPPIATRAGWISIAIMPFMMHCILYQNQFCGDVVRNISREIASLPPMVGCPHVYRGIGTHLPFIIVNKKMGVMKTQYTTSPWYWTGIAALLPQTYLMALSWGIFRGPYYETFKKLHFIASGIFMAALFIHVNFRLTSWDYFWATAAIYTLAWLARVLRTVYITGIGLPASVESVGESMLKISISVPRRFKWAPGQHIFVRFLGLGIHALSSHPFTVSSVHTTGEDNTVELVLRVHGGITRALAQKVFGKPGWSTRVVVDGPYGGVHIPLQTYDRVVLLAGGSGATFTLPLLLDVAKAVKTGGAACKNIEFVVAIRDRDSYNWLESTVSAASALVPDPAQLAVRVHLTRTESDGKSDSDDSAHKLFEHGRPNLPEIVHAAHASSPRVAIVACGPDSFLYDVRNAVADCELVIVDGFGGCKDLFLHTETYTLALAPATSQTLDPAVYAHSHSELEECPRGCCRDAAAVTGDDADFPSLPLLPSLARSRRLRALALGAGRVPERALRRDKRQGAMEMGGK